MMTTSSTKSLVDMLTFNLIAPCIQRCLSISDQEMLDLGIGIGTLTEKPPEMEVTKKQDDEPNNKPGPVPTVVTIITTSTTTQKTVVDTKDPIEVGCKRFG